jgi:RNA 3'-terminal phosphate cyclase (ATP)
MESSEEDMIEIDGSYGEGGGQILRTSLALSAILKRPITLHHIRANRKNPGLAPQHLTGVEALARMTGAKVQGAHIGSQRVSFVPERVEPGEYHFQVGDGKRSTAGSVTLLLQTLLPPLSLSPEPSRLTLAGGTHVPWSPPSHYLTEVFFPVLNAMGASIKGVLNRWGWYPRGGGILEVQIQSTPGMRPILLMDRGSMRMIRGFSATSNLPRHVAERQRDYALRWIDKEMKMDAEIDLLCDAPSDGTGSFVFLVAESERAVAGFSSLGARGRPAEDVAREAVVSLKEYIDSGACIDPHLADQLLLFMSLTKGHSSFTTHRITNHLLTNLWVIRQFLGLRLSVSGEEGKERRVDIFNE